MISVIRASERNSELIANIGTLSVEESHRGSSSAEVMNEFLENNYNGNAIREDLKDVSNIYHIINYQDKPAGFSKIILNSRHENIASENITKLDRIYLLKEFYGLQLGHELLNFNIKLSKTNNQSGIWLYVWIGNTRAIGFYQKAGFEIIGSYKFYVTKTHYDVSHQMFLRF